MIDRAGSTTWMTREAAIAAAHRTRARARNVRAAVVATRVASMTVFRRHVPVSGASGETDPVVDRHGPIFVALGQAARCLRCLATASGASTRQVADEISTVPDGVVLNTREGRCRDCQEYRFLFGIRPKA